jgi:hypothetical protein
VRGAARRPPGLACALELEQAHVCDEQRGHGGPGFVVAGRAERQPPAAPVGQREGFVEVALDAFEHRAPGTLLRHPLEQSGGLAAAHTPSLRVGG